MQERIRQITDTFNVRLSTLVPSDNNRDGLFEGVLGVVHYWIHMFRARPENQNKKIIEELLEYLVSRISDGDNLLAVSSSLSHGLSGFGYIIQELIKLDFLNTDDVGFMSDINDFIAEKAMLEIDNGNFDYMQGVPGMLYYLSRTNHPGQYKILDKMHSLLGGQEYPFYNKIDELYNKGVNFGIAHGILGLMMVCLEMRVKKASNIRSTEIAEHCLEVIKKSKQQNLVNGKSVSYPYNLFYNEKQQLVSHPSNRLAWCSGDLAVSYSLGKAALSFKDQKLLQESIYLGKQCIARKTTQETGIHMPIFCHGTSGAYILYKRLYELSSDRAFKLEADYWLEKTIIHLENELFGDTNFDYSNLLLGLSGAVLAINDKGSEADDWSKIFLL